MPRCRMVTGLQGTPSGGMIRFYDGESSKLPWFSRGDDRGADFYPVKGGENMGRGI
jgi:hypothetical protein